MNITFFVVRGLKKEEIPIRKNNVSTVVKSLISSNRLEHQGITYKYIKMIIEGNELFIYLKES